MSATGSTIQFLSNWREAQLGMIERGSRLTLDYDNAIETGELSRGAVICPEVVNVLEHGVAKRNTFPRPAGGGAPHGSNLQTSLDVLAWVLESPYSANAWIDLHVFDEHDELIEASTRTLSYASWGPDAQYRFADVVYQGSRATPGSVQPRPDARTLQYRLYYDVNYQVFTDGILHQFELPQDATVPA